jgi:hypothetical protein
MNQVQPGGKQEFDSDVSVIDRLRMIEGGGRRTHVVRYKVSLGSKLAAHLANTLLSIAPKTGIYDA